MISIEKFKEVSSNYDLHEIRENCYCKNNSSIFIKYDEDEVKISGIISMSLATMIYNNFKIFNNEDDYNAYVSFSDNRLIDPVLVMKNADLTRRTIAECVKSGKPEDYEKNYNLARTEVLMNDYDGCYISEVSVHCEGAYDIVLGIIESYYVDLEKTSKKVLT